MTHVVGPHRHSWNTPGRAHLLTFSCFGRRPFFAGQQSPQWFLTALGRARERGMFDLWAFVIMPEHVHLVLLPRQGVDVEDILSRVKHPVTRKCLHWVEKHSPSVLERMADRQPKAKVTHRFWQRGGGHDRNLRSVRDVHEKIRYVQNNPVRRGLVERAEDWPWSSARAFVEGTNEPITMDWGSLPPLIVT